MVGSKILGEHHGRWDECVAYETENGVRRVRWTYTGEDGGTYDFSAEEWDEEEWPDFWLFEQAYIKTFEDAWKAAGGP